MDWNIDTPALLQGRTQLVMAQNPLHSPDGDYKWWPEYFRVFSIAQPKLRREFFLSMGLNILVSPLGWFLLALEDHSQCAWAQQFLDHQWAEAQEWRERFL